MGDGRVGVITASIAYEYAKEVFPEGTSFLKLGLTFPLPMDLIRDFASKVEKLYVIEELEPFMEDQIKAAGIPCVGKELTGLLYELNTQLLRQLLAGDAFALGGGERRQKCLFCGRGHRVFSFVRFDKAILPHFQYFSHDFAGFGPAGSYR